MSKRHDTSKPRTDEVLGWGPGIPLREGLLSTYRSIESELRTTGKVPNTVQENLREYGTQRA